jgi:peptidyl-prolyl cis-trans isomerase D
MTQLNKYSRFFNGFPIFMLQSLRDHTHGWIGKVIIALLILSFALWGIHSYLAGGSVNSDVANVNGVAISKTQLAIAYERARLQMRAQSNRLSSGAEKNLKDHTLQELIYTQVLKQASFAQGYRISQDQVISFLESMPQFQVNEKFSMTRFKQALAAASYSVGDVLESMSTALLIDQPRLGMLFTSFSLPNEVEETIALVNQERDIEYLIFPFQIFSRQPISISHDKVVHFYEQHKEDFKTNEQVSVDYILLSNKSEEKLAMAREKLAKLTYEHPDTLAVAAKELGLPIKTSELFTKNEGGKDISTNNKVREIAFSDDVLISQNNSDVIQYTPDSVIVLRVKSHVPAAFLALSAVEKQIIGQLQKEEANAKTQALANEIFQKLRNETQPEKIIPQYSLRWQKAGMIGRHSTKIDPAIVDAAFSVPKLEGNKISYTMAKTPIGVAIIAVKAIQEGKIKSNNEFRVFAEQIQNAQGLIEYELYKQSLMNQAKIHIELS